MTTAQDIITSSLRRTGVTPVDESPDAADSAYALSALNTMIHGFKARGADFEHANYTLTDTVAIGEEFHEGLIYLLSARLAPDYSRPVPTANGFDIGAWWRTLLASKIKPTAVKVDGALLHMSATRMDYGEDGI